MKTIKKIWFDGEWLYGLGNDGKQYRQSLLWYKHLLKATEEQREQYEFSLSGIHWPLLDEDVSFESFLYEDAEPKPSQRFFLSHPEINVAGFARRFGLNPTLLRNYVNGFKIPSDSRDAFIMQCVRKLGEEYTSL